MDKLAKNKTIRQKIDAKLKSQRREITDLKRHNKVLESDLRRLGAVFVERDGRNTRIGVQMMVDERMANQYHEDYWEHLVCEIGVKLGRQIVSEKIKQAFKDGLGSPYQMAEAMGRWVYEAMRNSSVYARLNPEQLESAWNSALEAVTKYANDNQKIHARGFSDHCSMGAGPQYGADPAATQP